MSQQITGLPADARDRIEQRRDGLEAVVDDDGPFSPHAARLLELAADDEEVTADTRR